MEKKLNPKFWISQFSALVKFGFGKIKTPQAKESFDLFQDKKWAHISAEIDSDDLKSFVDLVEKNCRLIAIEKHINSMLVFYFQSEEKTYCYYYPTWKQKDLLEVQKMLLQTKFFKFTLINDEVAIQPIESIEGNETVLPVQYIDTRRGLVGKREVLKISEVNQVHEYELTQKKVT